MRDHRVCLFRLSTEWIARIFSVRTEIQASSARNFDIRSIRRDRLSQLFRMIVYESATCWRARSALLWINFAPRVHCWINWSALGMFDTITHWYYMWHRKSQAVLYLIMLSFLFVSQEIWLKYYLLTVTNRFVGLNDRSLSLTVWLFSNPQKSIKELHWIVLFERWITIKSALGTKESNFQNSRKSFIDY